MMISNMGSGMCSFFGMVGGIAMMAVPLIVVAAIAYLVFSRPQNEIH